MEESAVSYGLTDQWTDEIHLLRYYKEIYTGLSRKNRSEYGRNHGGIATPTTYIIYPHSKFSFLNVSEQDMHHYAEPLQPSVPEKILITMTALITGTLMMTLILNGSNRIQCIPSYILNIVSVRVLYHRC